MCCRAGLYKQLAEVKNLVSEFREDPQRNGALRGPIIENLRASGLDKDCPFRPPHALHANGHVSSSEDGSLTAESAAEVPLAEFEEYAGRLNSYLQAWPFLFLLCLCCCAACSGSTSLLLLQSLVT